MHRVRVGEAAALAAVLACAGLVGCNRNEASQPARVQTGDGGAPSSSGGGSYSDRGGYDRGDRSSSGGSDRYSDRGSDRGGYGGDRYANDNARPREAIPDFHGKPMWSDNRHHTAQENAQYHFEHDGADLGAKSLDDYLTKVHAFVDNPPAGAETLTRRNGDKLIYDPKANLFAVARRDGAPRTAFKPRDGEAYWKQQQARIEDEKNGRGSSYGGGERRSSRADRDEG